MISPPSSRPASCLSTSPPRHYSGAEPELLPGANKRDIHAAYVDWWTNALAASEAGVTYDGITTLPFDEEEEALVRRDGDPALVSRVLLTGVSGAHSPDGQKQDVVINHFADGNKQLHLPLVAGNSSSELSKRVPKGSGFKISFVSNSFSLSLPVSRSLFI